MAAHWDSDGDMRRLGEVLFTAYLAGSLAVIGILGLPLMLFGEKAARIAPNIWVPSNLLMLRLLTGVTHKIEGAENIPKDGAVIAANHQSMWETLALWSILPYPVAVLKQELKELPVFGWWARVVGNIAVDRKGGARALRAMREEARDKIAAGAQVFVFPEGTRARPGEKARLMPGAAGVYLAANAPCVPVAHDSGRFWLHPGIRKEPGVITIRFLAPIEPGLDRRKFMTVLEERLTEGRPDLAPPKETPMGEPSLA